MSEKIEYEEVTIKVPKPIMGFLRNIGEKPQEWIEYQVFDSVRAHLDAWSGTELLKATTSRKELYDLCSVPANT